MGKIKKIITHGGQAHRDDFMAVCLALAYLGDTPVERRDPTPAELDDPDVWVIDVGGRHEPGLGNFDHHQLPAHAPPTCSLTLVVQYIGIRTYEAALDASSWFKFTEVLDSKGPMQAQMLIGCSTPDGFAAALSPIEAQLIRAWSSGLVPNSLLRQLGHQWLKRWTDWRDNKAKAKRSSRFIGERLMNFMVCELPPTEDIGGVLGTLCREEEAKSGLTICGIIARDDRGPGWSLFRRNDHPRLDFRRIEGKPLVTYVHASGFIAKTEDVPVEEAIRLFREAIIQPNQLLRELRESVEARAEAAAEAKAKA